MLNSKKLLFVWHKSNVTLCFTTDQPNKMIALSGRYINDTSIQMELLSYTSRRQYSTESMMALTLNSSNILHTRLTWRPSMLGELQVGIAH